MDAQPNVQVGARLSGIVNPGKSAGPLMCNTSKSGELEL